MLCKARKGRALTSLMLEALPLRALTSSMLEALPLRGKKIALVLRKWEETVR